MAANQANPAETIELLLNANLNTADVDNKISKLTDRLKQFQDTLDRGLSDIAQRNSRFAAKVEQNTKNEIYRLKDELKILEKIAAQQKQITKIRKGGLDLQQGGDYNIPNTGIVNHQTSKPSNEAIVKDQITTVDIVYNTSLQTEAVKKELAELDKQILAHQNKIDQHLSKILAKEEKGYQTGSARRLRAISESERQRDILGEQIVAISNQSSKYQLSAEQIKNNTSLMASLTGKQKVLNDEIDKTIRKRELEVKKAEYKKSFDKVKTGVGVSTVEYTAQEREKLAQQERLKQKDELFKKYKDELALGDKKISQTRKITNASAKVTNAITDENRARKLKILEALREQAVTAKNITLAGQLTREIKKQREELNKSKAGYTGTSNGKAGFMDTMTGKVGSSFGHKLATTAQYATAGMIYYSVFSTITGAAKLAAEAITEFDLAARTMSAVLRENLNDTVAVTQSLNELGKAEGGALKDIYKIAQDLGRANIPLEDLVKASEVTIKMALLTGDSFQDASSAIISYQQVFGKTVTGKTINTIEQLGDKLAYVANVSRLSTQDIGTFSNYALSAAKSVGLTVDAVGAMAAAFSNAGVNASTIGTQIRRFTTLLTDNTTSVQHFFKSTGVLQNKLLADIQASADGTEEGVNRSNKAIAEFSQKLAQLSDAEFAKFTSGMDLLARNSLSLLRQQSNSFTEFLQTSISGVEGQLNATSTIVLSFSNSWQRIWNTIKDIAIDALSGIADEVKDVFSGVVDYINYALTMATGTAAEKAIAELQYKILGLAEAIDEAKEKGNRSEELRLKLQLATVSLQKEYLEKSFAVNKAREALLTIDKEIKDTNTQIAKIEEIAENKRTKNQKLALSILKQHKEELKSIQERSNKLVLDVDVKSDVSQDKLKSIRDNLQKHINSMNIAGLTIPEGLQKAFDLVNSKIEKAATQSAEAFKRGVAQADIEAFSSVNLESLNHQLKALTNINASYEKQYTYIKRATAAQLEGERRALEKAAQGAELGAPETNQYVKMFGSLKNQKDVLDAIFLAQSRITELSQDKSIAAENETHLLQTSLKYLQNMQDIITKRMQAEGVIKSKLEEEAKIQFNLDKKGINRLKAEGNYKAKVAQITNEKLSQVTIAENELQTQSEIYIAMSKLSDQHKDDIAYQKLIKSLMEDQVALLIKGSQDVDFAKLKERARYQKTYNTALAKTAAVSADLNRVDLVGWRKERQTALDQSAARIIKLQQLKEQDPQRAAEYNALLQEEFDLIDKIYQKFSAYAEVQKVLLTSLSSGLEDVFIGLTKGTDEWADALNNVGDALLKAAFNAMILQPLINSMTQSLNNVGGLSGIFTKLVSVGASAITGASPSSEASGMSYAEDPNLFSLNAQGSAWNNGIKFYANGGIIDRLSMFGTKSGMGVAGEAGPEVIAPLKRDRNGNMGVTSTPSKVEINLYNEGGTPLDAVIKSDQFTKNEQGEETRIVNVIIKNLGRNNALRNAVASVRR